MKKKDKLRASKEWKDFRKKMAHNHHNTDDLTNRKLYRGWNLHHQDMSEEKYSDLNPNNFNCLNRESHRCVHFLYRYYIKDRDILKRLRKILDKMVELNEGEK